AARPRIPDQADAGVRRAVAAGAAPRDARHHPPACRVAGLPRGRWPDLAGAPRATRGRLERHPAGGRPAGAARGRGIRARRAASRRGTGHCRGARCGHRRGPA
ncbi:hypothetical protein RZS08_03535, partial [Arthrospira platensis SPKY1]|nr:hypothetical protein [Arthrospira platensis SPKY1]